MVKLSDEDKKVLEVLQSATAPMDSKQIWKASRIGSRMTVVTRLKTLVRCKRAKVVDEFARMRGKNMLYMIGTADTPAAAE